MSDDLRNRVAQAIANAREGGWPADTYAMLQQHYLTMADAALAEMGGVRVVPLKWDEDPRAGWKRGRIVGLSPRDETEATIFRVEGGWQYMGDVYLAAHDSLGAALDRAKAAAQADYEARILAAIEPASSVRDAAREDALREAAEAVNRNLGKPAHHAHGAILALIDRTAEGEA